MNNTINHIPYVDLSLQWEDEKNELLPIIEKIFSSGQYIDGDEIRTFEKEVLKFTGTKFAVALNSGTDALTLALAMSGVRKGDEVITPPNSFIASTGSIAHLGAKPVFVDVGEDRNIDPDKIEKLITKKTKVIMPVHLSGRVCNMEKILEIANKYNIKVVEDAAQSIGSKFNNSFAGSFGYIGCFSGHPLKNLNACGDSGYLTTNSEEIYNQTIKLRNHGLINRNVVENFGYVSRMDTLQAAVLNYRLKHLNEVIKKRRRNADYYFANLNKQKIKLPFENSKEFNTYHTFVIEYPERDKLQNYLKEKNIFTAIHYPIPIHLQQASRMYGFKKGDFPETEKQAGEILAIPIHQYLREDQLKRVSDTINEFVD